jgi:hypothetical protein
MNTATKMGEEERLALLLRIPEMPGSNLNQRNTNHPKSVMNFASSSRHAIQLYTHENGGSSWLSRAEK